MSNSYRKGVGIFLISDKKKVWVGKRLDSDKYWQMPQGGIDTSETELQAMKRELKEETSIINIEFVNEYPEWLNYDIPLPLADNLWEGKYRGQTQRWLLFHFMGKDKEIDINTNHPEFKNWIWLNPELLPKKAISFKKDVYRKINKIFIPMIKNFNASNFN